MHNQLMFLLSTLSLTSASTNFNYPVYGSGVWNETYALSANLSPNATRSVPFSLGAQNYTFQVNVAEFSPGSPGTNNYTQNQRIAASFYNMLWTGGSSLNQSLQNASGLEKNDLCLVFPMGPLNGKATNGYKEQDEGDCTNALGSKCMKDLAELESNTLAGACTGRWMPESCSASFGDGGLASSSITDPPANNDTVGSLYQQSPREIAWYQSAIHTAGDMSDYDREIERLHVIFLSATGWGVTPVCTRVNTTRVSKNNDAVFSGAAEGSRGSLYLSTGFALTVAAFVF